MPFSSGTHKRTFSSSCCEAGALGSFSDTAFAPAIISRNVLCGTCVTPSRKQWLKSNPLLMRKVTDAALMEKLAVGAPCSGGPSCISLSYWPRRGQHGAQGHTRAHARKPRSTPDAVRTGIRHTLKVLALIRGGESSTSAWVLASELGSASPATGVAGVDAKWPKQLMPICRASYWLTGCAQCNTERQLRVTIALWLLLQRIPA